MLRNFHLEWHHVQHKINWASCAAHRVLSFLFTKFNTNAKHKVCHLNTSFLDEEEGDEYYFSNYERRKKQKILKIKRKQATNIPTIDNFNNDILHCDLPPSISLFVSWKCLLNIYIRLLRTQDKIFHIFPVHGSLYIHLFIPFTV